VRLRVRALQPVNQTVGELNANSCETVKTTDYKFDTCACFQGQSGHNVLKFMEKGSGQGHVTSEIFGR